MLLIRSTGELCSLVLTCVMFASTAAVLEAQDARRPAPQSTARTSVQDGGRIRPPDAVTCDRNHLTSYTGRVLFYSRRAGRVVLRIRTDEETTETVTLRHPRGSSPAKWFLLGRERFKASDWSRIESSKGRLLPDMRVTAWVCDDGNRPIIDWQPKTDDGPSPPPPSTP